MLSAAFGRIPKAIVLVLGGLACAHLFPQGAAPEAKLPSVAIIDPRGNPKITEMDRRTFRATIGEYIIASKRYDLVDRAQIERVLKEQKFQRDGLVNPSTMKRIGGLLGADIICAIDLLREGGDFAAEISLIDVESGKIYSTVQEIAEKDNAKELKKLAETMGGRLLQIESPREAYEREQREKRMERERADQKRLHDEKLTEARREREAREEKERAEKDSPKESIFKAFLKGGRPPTPSAPPPSAVPEAQPPAAAPPDDNERVRKETEERVRKETEQRVRKETEERVRKETEARVRKEAEDRTRREAEARAAEARATAPSASTAVRSAKATISRLAPEFTFDRKGDSVSSVNKSLDRYRVQGMQAVINEKAKFWHSLFVEIQNGELQATSRYVFANKTHRLSHAKLTVEIDSIAMEAQLALTVQRLSIVGITTETATISNPGVLRFMADNPDKRVSIRIEGEGGASKEYVLSEVAHRAIAQTLELYDAMETLKMAGVPLEQQYDQ